MDGNWFRIMLTPSEGCWVPAGAGTPSGDTTHVRVLAAIPTTTGAACSSFKDKTSCNAQVSCQWKLSTSGPGVCKNK